MWPARRSRRPGPPAAAVDTPRSPRPAARTDARAAAIPSTASSAARAVPVPPDPGRPPPADGTARRPGSDTRPTHWCPTGWCPAGVPAGRSPAGLRNSHSPDHSAGAPPCAPARSRPSRTTSWSCARTARRRSRSPDSGAPARARPATPAPRAGRAAARAAGSANPAPARASCAAGPPDPRSRTDPARGVSADGVSSADGSAATPAVADGSSSPAGVTSLLRPNSDRCRFASRACSPASRSCAACKSDCAASSARWSCSQRAHAVRPPTGCPFLLDFVLPTTTGLTAQSYDGKVAQAKSSAQPFYACLPIHPLHRRRPVAPPATPELLAAALRLPQKSSSPVPALLSWFCDSAEL